MVSLDDKEKKKAYMAEYYRNNRDKYRRTPEQQEKHNAARREKYAKDKGYRETIKSKVREYQAANPDKRKAVRLRRFSLTLQEFEMLLNQQGGKCAICGYDDLSDKNFFPLVDHDHKTGIVRGLLCLNCNQALGKLKDSVQNLDNAKRYLLEWSYLG